MIESFSESRIPKWVIPISSKTSMASLRMGPRQTTSGFRSSQAKERTQAEEDRSSWRSRWVSGLFVYQSSFADIVGSPGTIEGSLAKRRSVELALRAGHRRRLVVAEHEVQVLRQHLAQVGGHHQRGDGAEGEALLRVHELLLVAAVQRRLLLLHPLQRLALRVLLRGGGLHAGGGALRGPLLHQVGGGAADLAELVL